MSGYNEIKEQLVKSPKNCLVTGVVGFIGLYGYQHFIKLNIALYH